jgi:hypothetical protein
MNLMITLLQMKQFINQCGAHFTIILALGYNFVPIIIPLPSYPCTDVSRNVQGSMHPACRVWRCTKPLITDYDPDERGLPCELTQGFI